MNISGYIIIIIPIMSALITAQFGYLAYLLNFTDSIKYSFSIGVIGNSAIVDTISKKMPIVFSALFMTALLTTLIITMTLINMMRKRKTED